ncbi:Hypothetical predicted protein [Paramuricea clavata]|uniref:Pentraxin (PTX) domain-containing protein n=1 Tax=Paramuricea clavata TaxID=317549 RepID=A0A6S7H3W4_PARCT|nr:Hypothetical predicted protein [Paramuricea clavata]
MDENTVGFTSISPEGRFLIGTTRDEKNGPYIYSSGFVGTLSCLNIWSVELSFTSIYSMSSGAMNINGDCLAWRYVLGMIVGNLTIVPNTIIYYPGYSLLEQRSKWCSDHMTSLSCPTVYARLGIGNDQRKMLWRCYCSEALVPSKYCYSILSNSTAYETKHNELVAIN